MVSSRADYPALSCISVSLIFKIYFTKRWFLPPCSQEIIALPLPCGFSQKKEGRLNAENNSIRPPSHSVHKNLILCILQFLLFHPERRKLSKHLTFPPLEFFSFHFIFLLLLFYYNYFKGRVCQQ